MRMRCGNFTVLLQRLLYFPFWEMNTPQYTADFKSHCRYVTILTNKVVYDLLLTTRYVFII